MSTRSHGFGAPGLPFRVNAQGSRFGFALPVFAVVLLARDMVLLQECQAQLLAHFLVRPIAVQAQRDALPTPWLEDLASELAVTDVFLGFQAEEVLGASLLVWQIATPGTNSSNSRV